MKILVLCICVALSAAAWYGEAAAQTLQQLYQTGRIEFVEDVVFGSDEDESALFGPMSVCVDDEGYVYILDYKMYCIKKFGSDGEHL